MLSNRGNQRGNTCDDGRQSGHNDGHAGAQRSSQARNTDRDGSQSGSHKEQPRAKASNTNADQSESATQSENGGEQRGQDRASRTNHSKGASNRNKPLCNRLPAHTSEGKEHGGQDGQSAGGHEHGCGARQSSIHEIQTDCQFSQSAAHGDKALCDAFPTHAAHFAKGFCQDIQCRADRNQSCTGCNQVLRHGPHSDGYFRQRAAHRQKTLTDLLQRHAAKVRHGGGKYLHGRANLNHSKAGGDKPLCISGQFGKGSDLQKKSPDRAQPFDQFAHIHLPKILTGRGKDLHSAGQNQDSSRSSHSALVNGDLFGEQRNLCHQDSDASQPLRQSGEVQLRQIDTGRGKQFDCAGKDDHLRGALDNSSGAAPQNFGGGHHCGHQSGDPGKRDHHLLRFDVGNFLQSGGQQKD